MSVISRAFVAWVVIGVAFAVSVAVLVYLGVFNVAADDPHSAAVFVALELARDRSIAMRVRDLQVPALDDPALVAEGAEHYGAMCAGCHLAPDARQSEIRDGLYPQPPDLTQRADVSPAEQFWVVKHGIKMSAMPAWGKSHDDRSIWGIVAFLRRLPDLSPEQYRAMVDAHVEHHDQHDDAGSEHHHSHNHHHEADHAHQHAHTDAPR